MKGFTDKALLLLSDPSDLEEVTTSFRVSYMKAVENIIEYLKDNGIQHYCLLSDALTSRINMHNPVWLATGDSADMFFMQNFCSVPKYEAQPLTEDLALKVRTKFPIERGLSPEERFDIVSKRVRFTERALISRFNFVVVFGKQYNPTTKPGDGRAVMRVDSHHFYTSLQLSGENIPINDFMQLSYANQCLSEWGKYNGTRMSGNT